MPAAAVAGRDQFNQLLTPVYIVNEHKDNHGIWHYQYSSTSIADCKLLYKLQNGHISQHTFA